MSRRLPPGRVREQFPEPARFWVRYCPRRWPGPAGRPWLDLAAGTLGEPDPGDEESLRELEHLLLDDVFYLPPVPPSLVPWRDRLASAHLHRGTPVLVQLLVGDPLPPVGCVWVLDLLEVALATESTDGPPVAEPIAPAGSAGRASASLPRVPPSGSGSALDGDGAAADSVAGWPLLPGIGLASDRPGLPASLRAAGCGTLQAVTLDLTPPQRRRLAGGLGDEAGLALFHASPPQPREAVRAALEEGFAPYLPRPLPRAPLHGAGNLRLAAALALAAELGVVRGEPASRAQAFLRAARWAERSPHDLEAMARDGHLPLLPWLEEGPRRLLAEAAGREPAEVQEALLEPERRGAGGNPVGGGGSRSLRGRNP